ncbi:RNA 2',3'-cyclic phosphodiesterase [Indiicoccus explosivorum]|uniref:RNA 2',3'-cyclic phosphodiesterase n=1 Tax=Indiicoccus explosivorum TaxID=1917864 RepID=UPI000B452369|nr:RNA 2',3'-cyclic phosphodiesterase [Indiicoccus explosivorum]
MSNHYFIGIGLTAEAAGKLAEDRDNWKLRSHKQLIPSVDMHITLVYIGADPYGELPDVQRALRQIEQQPFEVTVSGTGTFGNPETPRVIYGKIGENSRLRALQQEVSDALEPFRLRPDRRPYVPHITLAKKWRGTASLDRKLELRPVSFPVREFSLFKVNLGQTPRYEAIYTFPLGAGD